MSAPFWEFAATALFGLLSAAGVWICYWYQRIGWTITLAANLLLVSYGIWTEQYGFSVAVPLAAAAQVHHLYCSRHEPLTGRRVPAARPASPTPAKRTRRRIFRHEVPLQYTPGRVPASTAILPATVEPEPTIVRPMIGVVCPCGCGTFAPSDFVAHLERNRGNLSHWAVSNRG